MKLSSAVVYAVARFQVAYALLTRSVSPGQTCRDTLPPLLIPSVIQGDWTDRVLAEIDQDGYTFAVDERDAVLFNNRPRMNRRRHNRIQIIFRHHKVYLRKSAIRKQRSNIAARLRERLIFFVEAASLLRLRGLEFVPTITRIEPDNAAIEMDYVWGRDLRQVLAAADGMAEEINYKQIDQSFSRLLEGENEISTQVRAIVDTLVRRGVIPRDIHAANFIQAERSKRLYIVDFQVSHLRPAPGSDAYFRNLLPLLQRRPTSVNPRTH